MKLAAGVLMDYDNMKTYVPAWYQGRKLKVGYVDYERNY